MAVENNLPHERETGRIEIDADVIQWVDVIAECYGMKTREVSEQFLRHGAVHQEKILRD